MKVIWQFPVVQIVAVFQDAPTSLYVSEMEEFVMIMTEKNDVKIRVGSSKRDRNHMVIFSPLLQTTRAVAFLADVNLLLDGLRYFDSLCHISK